VTYTNSFSSEKHTMRRSRVKKLFNDYDELIISMSNTKSVYKKKYRIVTPVDNGTQNCLEVVGTYVTTDNPSLSHIGITHVEGGWPKDINRLDEEQTARYRKKQEKDESYLIQMKGKLLGNNCFCPSLSVPLFLFWHHAGLIKLCEHAIFQNNAINLYENYFDELEVADLRESYHSKTLNMYRDKTKVTEHECYSNRLFNASFNLAWSQKNRLDARRSDPLCFVSLRRTKLLQLLDWRAQHRQRLGRGLPESPHNDFECSRASALFGVQPKGSNVLGNWNNYWPNNGLRCARQQQLPGDDIGA